jgi:hypothetical protein
VIILNPQLPSAIAILDDEIIAMLDDGYSADEVARHLGCSIDIVRIIIDQNEGDERG